MTLTRAALGLSALMTLAAPAWAIDVAPGDYAIAPAGTNIGLLYWQHQSAGSFEINGAEVPASRAAVDVGVLRGLHYTEAFGMPALLQAVLPVVSFDTARLGGVDQPTAQGFGDLTLGFSVWPVQPDTPETGTTLGLTAFLTAPTGSYTFGEVSAGSGGWVLTPQVGLIQGLGGGLYLDAVLDVALSADHTEAGTKISRSPAAQAQLYLRKQFGQATAVSFGVSSQRGGKVEHNGADTGLRTDRDQLRLYASHFVTPTLQLQGMVATDLRARGTFENDYVTEVRLLKLF